MPSRRISRPPRFPWLFLLLACLALPATAQSIRILVQSSPLAGFQYHTGAAVWETLKVGDKLTLQREPGNPHDPHAVRVDWRGQPLGYLPRAENGAVAAEMDQGGRVEARIGRLRQHRNPWQRVLVEVYVVL
ncbi:MAG: HIRAN domain-containing protein [Betaproteobacteria bacterium]|nr:HIRAN domain-containing protein [Betaproteobacteria bacterium]